MPVKTKFYNNYGAEYLFLELLSKRFLAINGRVMRMRRNRQFNGYKLDFSFTKHLDGQNTDVPRIIRINRTS